MDDLEKNGLEMTRLIQTRRKIEGEIRWKTKTMEEVSRALDRMIARKIQRITIFRNGSIQEK
jgi:hypothetical protein